MPLKTNIIAPKADPRIPSSGVVGWDRSASIPLEFDFNAGSNTVRTDLFNYSLQIPIRSFAVSSSVIAFYRSNGIHVYNLDGTFIKTINISSEWRYAFTGDFKLSFTNDDTLIVAYITYELGPASRCNFIQVNIQTGVFTRGWDNINSVGISGSHLMRGFSCVGDSYCILWKSNTSNQYVLWSYNQNTRIGLLVFPNQNEYDLVDVAMTTDRVWTLVKTKIPLPQSYTYTYAGREYSRQVVDFTTQAYSLDLVASDENNQQIVSSSTAQRGQYVTANNVLIDANARDIVIGRYEFNFETNRLDNYAFQSIRHADVNFSAWQIRKTQGITETYWNGSSFVPSSAHENPADSLEYVNCVEDVQGSTCWRYQLTNWNTNDTDLQLQVRTKDSAWSQWSDVLKLKPGTPPTVSGVVPADGDPLAPYGQFEWQSVGQTYFTLDIYLGSRLLYGSSGDGGVDMSESVAIPELTDRTELTVTLTVYNADFVGNQISQTNILRYQPPAEPNIETLEVEDDIGVKVNWNYWTVIAGAPPITRIELYRRAGSDVSRLFVGTPDTTTFTDYWAPFNEEPQYRVLGYGARDEVNDETPWKS